MKILRIFTIVALIIILILLILYKFIDNGVTEYYSQYWVSNSISDSQEKGVFLEELKPIPQKIEFDKHEIVFDEAWIEHISKVNYKLLFFRDFEILNRYRLAITLKEKISSDSLFIPFAFGENDYSFALTGNLDKEVFYEEININEIKQDTLYISLIKELKDQREKQIKLIKIKT